jgi:Tol biopolymer transport system component/DNA-binding winged helix-turn-helix (wHTH) protein
MPQVGTSQTIRFATFELDLQAQELRKAGVRLKLTGQPFQVLAILLEQPGTVVTRDELQKRLWPDTFVDVDHNLNTAINKIREALGDSSENPRFVETLPRRGYRFIGQVSRQIPSVADSGEITKGIGRKIAAWTLAGAVFVVAGFSVYLRSRPRLEPVSLSPRPFTSYPGVETAPAFSPDGSRIAFAWNGDAGAGRKGFDLYVKAIGSETLLRLTNHPSEFISPAWSPDGTQIAFYRLLSGDTGIYVVPALGGPERKLHSTNVPHKVDIPISWSPDGRDIAFTDFLAGTEYKRVYLLSLETLETRQVPNAPKCTYDGLPAFSHSGKDLAYECLQHTYSDFGIYSVGLPDGPPKLVATHSNFPIGMAWSADDSRLLFSEAPGENDSWINEVRLADGSVHRLPLPHSATKPTISVTGNKLAYSASSDNINIWRKDLVNPDSPAVRLLTSTREQADAQYSPDGRHIAFDSSRAGNQDVWLSDAEGGNLVQLSTSGGGNPRWSHDGSKIVFDNDSDIYIVDVSERVPRKLVTNVKPAFGPTWSHDDKWIYFTTALGERIFRCPAVSGEATPVSSKTAYRPLESSDGKTVYFVTRPSIPTLKAVSVNSPGTEYFVQGIGPLLSQFKWTIAPAGIYFVSADARRSLQYFDFGTKRVRRIFDIDRDFADGLSVSPDGRWVLYSQVDVENRDIMIVDHFH